ncbi:MAG: hypothetical protein L0229_15235 [Blastocatellia bacterium]|nr:hypothetical protein [Blastocatellia bacterium]
MKKAYLVTEGPADAEIIKKLLPDDIVQDIEFVVGSGLYSAQSLARSILAVKETPVALVLNADMTNEASIQEKEDFYREALRQASSGAKFEVFLAKPGVDTFVFQNPHFMEWLAEQNYSKADLNTLRSHSGEFLYKSESKNSQDVLLLENILDDIDRKTIKAIQKSTFINDLIKFLSSVIGKKK